MIPNNIFAARTGGLPMREPIQQPMQPVVGQGQMPPMNTAPAPGGGIQDPFRISGPQPIGHDWPGAGQGPIASPRISGPMPIGQPTQPAQNPYAPLGQQQLPQGMQNMNFLRQRLGMY